MEQHCNGCHEVKLARIIGTRAACVLILAIASCATYNVTYQMGRRAVERAAIDAGMEQRTLIGESGVYWQRRPEPTDD